MFRKYWATKRFCEKMWISYKKWYKFYSTNLSVAFLGSKQGGTLKLVNPKHEDWASIFFTLPRCQVIFQWKQTKEKLENALALVWVGWGANFTHLDM